MNTRRAAFRRTLRKATRRPGHVALGSATLAIAVAVFFAIFALVDGLLFTPPAFSHHGDVVMYGDIVRPGFPRSVAASTYDAIGMPAGVLSRGLARAVERVSGRRGTHVELLSIQRVDAGFLPTLGVEPALGDIALERGGRDGAIISWRLWQAWFNGSTALEGMTIVLDGRSQPVVGVLPARYRLFEHVDLLLPLRPAPGAARTVPNYMAVARLAPGIPVDAFAAHVAAAAARDGARPGHYGATPIDTALTEASAPNLWFFLGCTVLVLATACGNLANLMLARALGRSQETALRRALGAGFWGTWSTAAFEASLIGLGGLAVGCLLGHGLVRAGETFIPDAWRINAGALTIGWRVYAATALVATMAAALAVVGGTLHEQGDALLRGYAGGGPTLAHGMAANVRVAMVQFQLALATVLLSLCVARAVLAWRIQDVQPGFDPSGAIAVRFRPDPAHFSAVGLVADAMSAIERRARGADGVMTAGVTTQLPAAPRFVAAFAGTDGRATETQLAINTAGARAAIGLRLVGGRDLAASDTATTESVAIVNEAFLAAIPGAAVGATVRKVSRSLGNRELRIVGVVGDTRDAGPAVPTRPLAILPFAQLPPREFESFRSLLSFYLVVRGAVGGSLASLDAGASIRGVAPWLAMEAPRSLQRTWHDSRAAIERDTWLATLLAAIGLGLGLVGLYSAQRVEVASRRRDLGLCAALGARPSDLMGMCLARGIARASVGISLGVAAAFALGRLPPLRFVPEIRLEPASALIVAVAMLGLTATAAWLPAWRSATTPASLVLRNP